MTVVEKVSYLKGLAEGLDLDKNDKSVKLINAIIETLEEMAEGMSELELDVADISDQVDAVDEDLADVEDYLYDDLDGEDGDFYEIDCPECGETICIDESVLDDTVDCPACGANLKFEIEEEDSEEE